MEPPPQQQIYGTTTAAPYTTSSTTTTFLQQPLPQQQPRGVVLAPLTETELRQRIAGTAIPPTTSPRDLQWNRAALQRSPVYEYHEDYYEPPVRHYHHPSTVPERAPIKIVESHSFREHRFLGYDEIKEKGFLIVDGVQKPFKSSIKIPRHKKPEPARLT